MAWKNFHWLFIFFVSFCLLSCDKPKASSVAETPQEKLIKTIKLQGKKKLTERYFPGTIVANQKVDLAFQVSGQINDLPIDKGEKVKQNQVLAKLDPREFASKLKEAKASYTNAKAQYERAAILVTKGHISKSDYDKLLSQYEQSQAKLSLAEKDLSDTIIKAPFDGIVANKYVDNYQNIQEKQKILSLQDISHVDIYIYLPEQDLVYAKQYAAKKNSSQYYIFLNAVPDRKFKVSLKEITAEADPITNTYQVTLTMPAPEDLTILPGMAVTFVLEIPLGEAQESLNVPIEAVAVDEKGDHYVWVVDEKNNTVHKVKVTLGMATGRSMQILKGLSGDELLVSAGLSALQEGSKVRLWENKASSQK